MDPIEELRRESDRLDAQIKRNLKRQSLRLAIITILLATAAAIYYL
mgnify:CR=1 FL=1